MPTLAMTFIWLTVKTIYIVLKVKIRNLQLQPHKMYFNQCRSQVRK